MSQHRDCGRSNFPDWELKVKKFNSDLNFKSLSSQSGKLPRQQSRCRDTQDNRSTLIFIVRGIKESQLSCRSRIFTNFFYKRSSLLYISALIFPKRFLNKLACFIQAQQYNENPFGHNEKRGNKLECFFTLSHFHNCLIFAAEARAHPSGVHRHLSNINCLIAHTACLVCFISTVNGRSKKKENALEGVAQVASAQQNLSNLYS